MTERDSSKTNQNEKQLSPQQQEEQKKQPDTKKQQKQAGNATDPAAVNDKEYVKRIEEKTEKH